MSMNSFKWLSAFPAVKYLCVFIVKYSSWWHNEEFFSSDYLMLAARPVEVAGYSNAMWRSLGSRRVMKTTASTVRETRWRHLNWKTLWKHDNLSALITEQHILHLGCVCTWNMMVSSPSFAPVPLVNKQVVQLAVIQLSILGCKS